MNEWEEYNQKCEWGNIRVKGDEENTRQREDNAPSNTCVLFLGSQYMRRQLFAPVSFFQLMLTFPTTLVRKKRQKRTDGLRHET